MDLKIGSSDQLFPLHTTKEFGIGNASPDAGVGATQGTSFGKVLSESLDKVNQYQVEADKSISEMVAGRTKNPHEAMMAIERAEIAFKLMMQVRNKVLDAYREIMRLQV